MEDSVFILAHSWQLTGLLVPRSNAYFTFSKLWPVPFVCLLYMANLESQQFTANSLVGYFWWELHVQTWELGLGVYKQLGGRLVS